MSTFSDRQKSVQIMVPVIVQVGSPFKDWLKMECKKLKGDCKERLITLERLLEKEGYPTECVSIIVAKCGDKNYAAKVFHEEFVKVTDGSYSYTVYTPGANVKRF